MNAVRIICQIAFQQYKLDLSLTTGIHERTLGIKSGYKYQHSVDQNGASESV